MPRLPSDRTAAATTCSRKGPNPRAQHAPFLRQDLFSGLVIEGGLEVKLPTMCRDGKAEVGRVREEKSRSEKIRDGESQKQGDAGARKGREVAIHYVFFQ